MRKQNVLLVGVMLVLSLGSLPAAVRATPATDDSQIEVTGEGALHAAPDIARVTLGVELYGSQVAATDREADQRVTGLVRTLRSAGVAEGHIRTAALTIEPRYETRAGEPMAVTGYVVRNMLEIETSNISGLPALLDSAITGGANCVESVQFESRNLADLRSQAREFAWQSARSKAEQIAIKSGLRLGNVMSVEEPLLETISTVRADPAPGAMGVDDGSVQRGEIEVRAQVHVVWSATP